MATAAQDDDGPNLSEDEKLDPEAERERIIQVNAFHIKIFTNWTNFILSQRGMRINDVINDLSTGVALINMAELLTHRLAGPHSRQPKLMAQKIENVNIALKLLNEDGCPVSADVRGVVDGDPKTILAMMWIMVKKYQLSEHPRPKSMLFQSQSGQNAAPQHQTSSPLQPSAAERPLNPVAVSPKLTRRLDRQPSAEMLMKLREKEKTVALKEEEIRKMHERLEKLKLEVRKTTQEEMERVEREKQRLKMEEEELLKRKNKELEEIAEMKRQHELKKRENEVAITESQREKARDLLKERRKQKEEQVEAERAERESAMKRSKEGDVATSIVAAGSSFDVTEADSEQSMQFCPICEDFLCGTIVLVDKRDLYHIDCFVCTKCGSSFDKYYWEYDGKVLCLDHYLEAAGHVCGKCQDLIRDRVVLAAQKQWHVGCFVCATCSAPFEDSYYMHDNKPYCKKDYYRAMNLLCAKCDECVSTGDKAALGKVWHKACFVCWECNEPFGPQGFFNHKGRPYCITHYRAIANS